MPSNRFQKCQPMPNFLITLTSCFVFLAMALSAAQQPGSPDTLLWYESPAQNWNEALPVGNGRLGAMVFGGVAAERLQLNEDSLWSGAPQEADNPAALEALPQIRQLLFEGKYGEAERLANRSLICLGRGSGRGRGARDPYGCYQTLGDLKLEFFHAPNAKPINYRRELDVSKALARVSYEMDGTRFTREVFASYPSQVLVVRLTADRPGALTLRASLSRPEAASILNLGDSQLVMRGQLWNGQAWEGMKYVARLQANVEGGSVSAADGALKIEAANAVTLYLAAATDYVLQLPGWRQGDPVTATAGHLKTAGAKGYQALRAGHIADHQSLFDRASINLGVKPSSQKPTDQRLEAVKAGGFDPSLVALYFNFGRYLLISSSRPGTMPANLQGLWADGLQTPWNCDYHANINLQMIYWPAETANLTECFEPLDRYISFLTEPGAKTAKTYYGARGWTVHTLANVSGFTSPSESPSWGLSPSAGAWLAQHLWEHYAFSGDTNYLRKVLPVLRGSAEFSLDWLVKDPKSGKLVAGPAPSPENKFITADGQKAALCMGPTMEQEIVWDAFQNYLGATRILGVNDPILAEATNALAQLRLPQVGRDGRLMEWNEEFQEAEPGHRHISHLFALHPGRQITRRGTPELAGAAERSLEYRLSHGGGHTGWSRAWVINFFARLGQGDKAGENMQALLAKSTMPNLFDTHPPFQIDGNFGGVAGVCEMLVQSHANEIELLPALPSSWAEGSFRGLRARGGFEVDASWAGGKLVSATIRGPKHAWCAVRYGNKMFIKELGGSGQLRLDGNLSPR